MTATLDAPPESETATEAVDLTLDGKTFLEGEYRAILDEIAKQKEGSGEIDTELLRSQYRIGRVLAAMRREDQRIAGELTREYLMNHEPHEVFGFGD